MNFLNLLKKQQLQLTICILHSKQNTLYQQMNSIQQEKHRTVIGEISKVSLLKITYNVFKKFIHKLKLKLLMLSFQQALLQFGICKVQYKQDRQVYIMIHILKLQLKQSEPIATDMLFTAMVITLKVKTQPDNYSHLYKILMHGDLMFTK